VAEAPISTPAQLRLIDVGELSRVTGLSKPTLWRHHEAGLIPSGMKIGRAVRWRLADITRWIESGCPRRDNFTHQEQKPLSQQEGVNHGE
jgi:predicted DNA-binding transcriptional regulator AlpA